MRKISKKLLPITIAVASCLNASFARTFEEFNFSDGSVDAIETYRMEIPNILYDMPKGVAVGAGSSLEFVKKDDKGNLHFLALTDRGASLSSPDTVNGEHTLIYVNPDFQIKVGKLLLTPQTDAIITKVEPLKNNGQNLIGIPSSDLPSGVSKEIPLNLKLEVVEHSAEGIDPESISLDPDGNFWVAEEYLPSLRKFDAKTGEQLASYSPGKGLPEIFANRQVNRGFEAIAVTPSGKVLAAIEGTLDINGETAANSNLVRFVWLDPQTGETKQFAYVIDEKLGKDLKDVRISELKALNENQFLAIQQGPAIINDSGEIQRRHKIIGLDLSNATDITGKILPDGRPLEYALFQESMETQGLKPIKQYPILTMEDYNWNSYKMEGLAIVDDQTLALTDDNDFGVKLKIADRVTRDPNLYQIDLDRKLFTHEGADTEAVAEMAEVIDNKTKVWLVKLAKPIKAFFEDKKEVNTQQ